MWNKEPVLNVSMMILTLVYWMSFKLMIEKRFGLTKWFVQLIKICKYWDLIYQVNTGLYEFFILDCQNISWKEAKWVDNIRVSSDSFFLNIENL